MLSPSHSQQTQIVVMEVIGVVVVVGSLLAQEFGRDVMEWRLMQQVLAPLRSRVKRKTQDVGPWQKKLVALFRRGEQVRIQRRG